MNSKFVTRLLPYLSAGFILLTTALQAQSPLQPGEFVKQWSVLGPIVLHDGEGDEPDYDAAKAMFAKDYLDDLAEIQATGEVTILDQKLAWKSVDSKSNTIDLDKEVKAVEWAICYLTKKVSSEVARKAILGVGSDDGVRIWVNGTQVHDHWVTRGIQRDQDIVPIELRAGENTLVVKVFNEKSGWDFALRELSETQQANQLSRAAVLRDRERIRELMAAGVGINFENSGGLTAYQASRVHGNDKIALMLQALGADKSMDFDPADYVDRMLNEEAKMTHPGIAVLAAIGDKVIISDGDGMANLADDIPVTTETKFRIGSVSKQFTAAAILKLQEAGKLSVHDKLTKFIADYPRGDEVTLHHLLTHTSGITSYTSSPEFFETVASPISEGDLIASFKDKDFEFEPGQKFEYCNSGYFLLGHIVGKVSGKSFEEFLETEFFAPLGMDSTGVHSSTKVLKHEALGYSVSSENVDKALDWDMSRAGGAGNIYSTVNDLHRWNEAVFNGKVLSPESLAMAHQIQVKDIEGDMTMPYGYGWMMDEHRGLKRVGHSGGLHGFVTYLAYYPEHRLTVVAFHNGMPGLGAFTPTVICEAMAQAILWKDMKPRPKHEIARDIDPETYDDYVGDYDYKSAVMKVTREGDKLMAQLTGQPKFEIYPEGKDKFFWKVVDAQVEFVRDASGEVKSVRHSQGIAKFEADRIEERTVVELSEETLERFVGKFEYKGLGTLTIRRDGKQLKATMTGQPEMGVFPMSESRFFWKAVYAELEFEFDESGNVIGGTHYQGGQELKVTRLQ